MEHQGGGEPDEGGQRAPPARRARATPLAPSQRALPPLKPSQIGNMWPMMTAPGRDQRGITAPIPGDGDGRPTPWPDRATGSARRRSAAGTQDVGRADIARAVSAGCRPNRPSRVTSRPEGIEPTGSRGPQRRAGSMPALHRSVSCLRDKYRKRTRSKLINTLSIITCTQFKSARSVPEGGLTVPRTPAGRHEPRDLQLDPITRIGQDLGLQDGGVPNRSGTQPSCRKIVRPSTTVRCTRPRAGHSIRTARSSDFERKSSEDAPAEIRVEEDEVGRRPGARRPTDRRRICAGFWVISRITPSRSSWAIVVELRATAPSKVSEPDDPVGRELNGRRLESWSHGHGRWRSRRSCRRAILDHRPAVPLAAQWRRELAKVR